MILFNRLIANASLRKKFLVLTLLVSILPVGFVGFFSYSSTMTHLTDNAYTLTNANLTAINLMMEKFLANVEEISLDIASNNNTLKYMEYKSSGSSIYDKSFLASKSNLRSEIHSIIIYDLAGGCSVFQSNNDPDYSFEKVARKLKLNESSFYNDVMELKGKVTWIKLFDSAEVVSLVRVLNVLGTQKPVGVLVINVFEKNLKEAINDSGIEMKSDFVVFDRYKNILYSNTTKEYPESWLFGYNTTDKERDVKYDGEKYKNIYYQSPTTGLSLLSIIPEKSIYINTQKIKNVTLLVLFLCLYAIIMLSVLVSSYLTKPIVKLGNLMEQVEKGDLSISFNTQYEDEIGKLGSNFNSMIQRIKTLIAENSEKQKRIRTEELKALQIQINPHLLYNTMDTINWMAQAIDAQEISNICIAFSNYYRISLSRGAEMIRLADEANHIKNYLTIQKIRYDELFEYEIEMEESILDLYIIKLTLQPIVENAIGHGLKDRDSGGLIKVIGRREGDNVVIDVLDNGNGMSQEALEDLRENVQKVSSKGYGLSNVNERIRLYFGDEYGLDIESELNSHTRVRVTIPPVTNPEKYTQSFSSNR
jgi:Predicted signal transduction protein with a C-terminal ATPase domain